jgi:mRNA-degrading endonuclease toxin of MazEF toxin-antitoxin module
MAVVVAGAQCPKQQARAGEQDSVRVVRLEREARALAKTDGCGSLEQCRSAPVGERPCGGPREYLVYCVRTTDTSALNRKLAELRQAEMELNTKSGAMSTCEFRTPPGLAISGGSCRAR